MSLYNMICGVNPASGLLLGLIDVAYEEIPRPRDVYLSDDGDHVIIYTRTGGGNREEYMTQNAALAKNPNYVGDHDDDFDSTFAHFKFKITKEGRDKLAKEFEALTDEEKKVITEVIKTTPGAKFTQAMKQLQGG